MENKKLVKILLKDMGEMEELIAELKANKRFDALEMEFVHTRAKGILQLLQMLDLKSEAVTEAFRVEQEIVKENSEQKKWIDEPVPEDQLPDDSSEKVPDTTEVQPEKLEEKEPVVSDSKTEAGQAVASENVENERFEDEGESTDDDNVLEEEELEKAEAVSRLGDSFLKGKSLNDLITDHNKLEFKLSNRPVGSIQAAIGINDRFQYIRELFDGNNQKFLETVKMLDSKENIKEAVDYLRNNYKWKKNETSLKFVNLVKRRFLHE